MTMPVNKEEWSEWLQHPVTVAYRKGLIAMKGAIQNDWAAGVYTAESSEGTAQRNAVALGQFRLLEDLLSLDEESL